jgi:hypothetical protein
MVVSSRNDWLQRVARAVAVYLRRASVGIARATGSTLGTGARTPCTGHDLDGIADETLARLRVACRA